MLTFGCEDSLQLNRLFNINGVYGVLVGKDYHSIDTSFSLILASANKATVYHDNGALNYVNSLHSTPLFEQYWRHGGGRMNE